VNLSAHPALIVQPPHANSKWLRFIQLIPPITG
jgi:hypothetical protein